MSTSTGTAAAQSLCTRPTRKRDGIRYEENRAKSRNCTQIKASESKEGLTILLAHSSEEPVESRRLCFAVPRVRRDSWRRSHKSYEILPNLATHVRIVSSAEARVRLARSGISGARRELECLTSGTAVTTETDAPMDTLASERQCVREPVAMGRTHAHKREHAHSASAG